LGEIAVNVENLGKQYRLGGPQASHNTLRDALSAAVRAPFRRLPTHRRATDLRPAGHKSAENRHNRTLWALKDISMDVQQGQVVGIIGRNGAGKSTLLKILSGITEPSEGEVRIRGRVGSLLEVGAGFHSELTGRENIYLSGAVLGMRKAEIEHKFDAIVAFSELERFLDTPVKYYSSGMYVRLGFAVAAHMEPEILLVDEVLAVGDAAFQKKCLGKMGAVTQEGRTVFFVSHNMLAVSGLCQRAFWLHDGRIEREGEATSVVSDYLQSNLSLQSEQVWDDIRTAPGNDVVRLRKVCAQVKDGEPAGPITMRTPFSVQIELWNLAPNARLHVNLHLITEEQVTALGTSSSDEPEWRGRPWPVGRYRCECQIPENLLNSGVHRISVLVIKDNSSIVYKHEDALSFNVMDPADREGGWYGKGSGAVRPALDWATEYIDEDTESLKLV
jgi:lipopolysaccharide transport system ATP-binding protein